MARTGRAATPSTALSHAGPIKPFSGRKEDNRSNSSCIFVYCRLSTDSKLAFPPFSTGCSPQSAMAYFKSGYGVNGLHLPMTTMDAASLHHSMGYTADPYLPGPPNRKQVG